MSSTTSSALRLGYHTSSVVVASVSALVCLRATYLLLTIDRVKLHATILASCTLLPANVVLALTSACISLTILSDGDPPGTCLDCSLHQTFEPSTPVRSSPCFCAPSSWLQVSMKKYRYSGLMPGVLAF